MTVIKPIQLSMVVLIIVNNFVEYCSERMITFGKWLLEEESDKLKNFLKDTVTGIDKRNIKDNKYENDGLYYQKLKWLTTKILRVINFYIC